MKQRLLIGMVCAAVLSAGCGGQPGMQGLSESSVIVAFGDSLTAGLGARKTESYPAALSGILGCPVVNAGVPGEDTTEGLARLPRVLKTERPNLVILCHGGNDMLNGEDERVTKQNLDAMISLIRRAGADVILIGVPRPALVLKVPQFYKDVAQSQGILLDTETLPNILSNPSLKSDTVHPNAAGYKLMAVWVAELIRNGQEADE